MRLVKSVENKQKTDKLDKVAFKKTFELEVGGGHCFKGHKCSLKKERNTYLHYLWQTLGPSLGKPSTGIPHFFTEVGI